LINNNFLSNVNRTYNISIKTYSKNDNNGRIFTEKSISEGKNKVKIFSVNYLKGLEFEAVFLIDINQIAEKNPELVATYLYTTLTRAVSFLAITYNRHFPESIEFVEKYFKDKNWNTIVTQKILKL